MVHGMKHNNFNVHKERGVWRNPKLIDLVWLPFNRSYHEELNRYRSFKLEEENK